MRRRQLLALAATTAAVTAVSVASGVAVTTASAQFKPQMITPPAGPGGQKESDSKTADKLAYPECVICGMNRETFAHSRMLVESQNGVRPTCSLNCALVVMAAEWNKRVVKIMVGDYKTKELIDARTATWVVGGDKRGVMHPRAKWAFANPADAKAFVAESGGEISSFDQAMAAASKDLYERILPRLG